MSKIKPNIVRGGTAIDLGNNLYLMKGRKHSSGGIDIGRNPRTGLEVEGDEVIQTSPSGLRVFSAQPILGGISPAQYILGGANPNDVFNAQEFWKKANRVTDDGKRYRTGGKVDEKTFTTKLTKKQEDKFQNWYKNVSYELGLDSNPDNPLHAYDYRGFWLENRNKDIDYTQPDFHFTDTYKKPDHPTFSVESKYADKKYGIDPKTVGHWDGENFISGSFNDLIAARTNRPIKELEYSKQPYEPSKEIIDYIKSTEGFRDKWYQDGKGIWTVGYGFTGSKVKKLFPNGMTREQADKYFADSLNVRKQILERDTPNWDSLNQNQRDALLSYHYNIGEGKYRNSPNMQKGLEEKDWDTVSRNIDAGYNDKKNPGLRKRRDYERNLFNTPVEYKYGGIHIKPSKRGTFTAAAKKHGMGVQAFASKVLANKDNYSPAMVKKANFARNASKWNHKEFGGDMTYSYILGKNNIYRLGGPVTPITEKRDNTSTKYAKDINPVKESKQNKSNLRYDDGIQGYLPIVGDVLQAAQGIKDIKDKNYTSGILSLGLLAAPNILEKPLKSVGKIVKKSISNKRVFDPHNIPKDISEKIKKDDAFRKQYIEESRKYNDIKNNLYENISGVDFDKMSLDDLYKYDKLQKRADALFNESMLYEYSPNPTREATLYHELNGVEKELEELKNIYKLPQNKHKADIIMHYDDLPFKYGGKFKYRKKAPYGDEIIWRPTSQDLHRPRLTRKDIDYGYVNGVFYDRFGNAKFDTDIEPAVAVAEKPSSILNIGIDDKRFSPYTSEELDAMRKSIVDKYQNEPVGNSLEVTNPITLNNTVPNPSNGFMKPNNNNTAKGNGINSDLIGAGINLVGNLGSFLINNVALNRMKYYNMLPLRANKLKTNFNINPQLDNIRENVADFEEDTRNNTASSKVALSRRQRMRARGAQVMNQLYGQKENIETQLINRDRLNQQQVANQNASMRNQWRAGLSEFRNKKLEAKAENAVAAINNAADAIAGPSGYLARRDRRLENDRLLARDLLSLELLSATNPNAAPIVDDIIKNGIDSRYYKLLKKQRSV